MDHRKLSDLEINLRVAEIIYPGKEFTSAYSFGEPDGPMIQWVQGYAEYLKLDYCNNPADAWPIIVGNRITLMPASKGDKWMSQAFDYAIADVSTNPLRSAMIVFLMMQGDE